ncbi:MAG: hypothetical protein G8345_03490 [Magnetococcales bacterium]|nr:hypothetical protein [Magnetococcales bacterium]NGZ25938.1 hypothetical protein [Magnetococcales bacterium]
MINAPDNVQRLNDPDFRLAEIAIKRAAEKAQRQIREAGFEPVIRHTPIITEQPNKQVPQS